MRCRPSSRRRRPARSCAGRARSAAAGRGRGHVAPRAPRDTARRTPRRSTATPRTRAASPCVGHFPSISQTRHHRHRRSRSFVLALCVVFALAAGLSFAVGAVLQQSAARQAPGSESLSWGLIVSLAHQKIWVVGIVSDVFSFALQAIALSMGPIALVQPLAVTGILFSIPLAVRWRGKRLQRMEWFATVLVASGLAMFLAAASPASGVAET